MFEKIKESSLCKECKRVSDTQEVLHEVLAVTVNALRKSKNQMQKNIILESWIQKNELPVFVLDLVLKNNRRRRATGTKGGKKKRSVIFF